MTAKHRVSPARRRLIALSSPVLLAGGLLAVTPVAHAATPPQTQAAQTAAVGLPQDDPQPLPRGDIVKPPVIAKTLPAGDIVKQDPGGTTQPPPTQPPPTQPPPAQPPPAQPPPVIVITQPPVTTPNQWDNSPWGNNPWGNNKWNNNPWGNSKWNNNRWPSKQSNNKVKVCTTYWKGGDKYQTCTTTYK